MSKINNAIFEIHEVDEMSQKNTVINQIHPLIKLFITLIYIGIVVSYDKYDLFGLLPLFVYPLIVFNLAEIKIIKSLKKLRIVLPIVCLVGILNPFFDQTNMMKIGDVAITGGMISMFTLMIKGIYTLMASFLLIATTGIEKIGYALKLLRIPSIMITQLLLSYRYLTVLMNEANTVFEAYTLRAPGQKGVTYKIWGSLIGQLLFRTIDRAENIYDSMVLRGFNGEYFFEDRKKTTYLDYLYLGIWLFILIALRLINIMEIAYMWLAR